MKKFYLLLPFLFASLCASTIAEKKASLVAPQTGEGDPLMTQDLHQVNLALEEKHLLLNELYRKGWELYQQGQDEASYKALTGEIKELHKEIQEISEMWRREMTSSEGYALWHQPEATLSQLLMDYGSGEFVYIIPPEIASIPISINSNLPIPKEAWNECLELVLKQNGIGIRELNPFLRELYLLKIDTSYLKCITNKLKDLDLLAPQDRICFVLKSDSLDPRSALNFLQRFSNPSHTTVMLIRSEIFIVASVDSIKELLKLYDFVKASSHGEEHQLITLSKVDAREMQAILESAFQGGEDTLRIIPLSSVTQSLFLYGSKEEVSKALKLVRDVESKIENAKAKTVFWYTTKHSEAEALASVLAKVYDLLIQGGNGDAADPALPPPPLPVPMAEMAPPPGPVPIVGPPLVTPLPSGRIAHNTSDGQNNFIVDPKTGSIIMVVEQDALPKIKELLKKLDVPKKMVQLEVLLFEKKFSNQNKSGLNLLKIGQAAKDIAETALSWNNPASGILEFFISRKKGSGIPAFDLAYNFLLGQEDVQINASPSVTTINQTPATIAVVDEISINTGADPEKEKNARNTYARAQYGITIQITPTINMGCEDGEDRETGYITLETDITFDTTKKSVDDRPDVTRRHIKNHVIIKDGETLILGGLRRKSTQDCRNGIPFLGEIPGLGKLFSTTEMYDNNSEMFIFITPKIISDHFDEAEKMKREELRKRPGDVPEFVHELLEAKNREKRKLFSGSMQALFGRYGNVSTPFSRHQDEYDGR